MTHGIDPRELALKKFAADRGLACGPAIDWLGEHATDAPIALRTLLDALAPAAGRGTRICELGFGSGWLLEGIRGAFPQCELYGLDLSESIARRARTLFGPDVRLVRGDMEQLPFRDASFDAIVTCWTLYFMRDIDAALVEFKRCLKPGARFVTATVAPDHMLEFEELRAEAIRAALGREPEPDTGARFDLTSGAPYVQRQFPNVELREWYGEIALLDLKTALELWEIYGAWELSGADQDRVQHEYARLVEGRLREHGEISVRRHDGLFLAAETPLA